MAAQPVRPIAMTMCDYVLQAETTRAEGKICQCQAKLNYQAFLPTSVEDMRAKSQQSERSEITTHLKAFQPTLHHSLPTFTSYEVPEDQRTLDCVTIPDLCETSSPLK